MKLRFRLGSVIGSLLLLTAGCSTPNLTNTKRSLIEQLLISTVVERGVRSLDFSTLRGQRVFMDYTHLDPQTDKAFLQGYLELHLSRCGLIVVPERKDAQLVAQVLCGVLATDTRRILIGTPELPIPLPDTNMNFAIPEIPLFSKLTQSCQGRFALNFLDAATSEHRFTIDSIDSWAYHTDWVVLLIPFATHNLPLYNHPEELELEIRTHRENASSTRLPEDIPGELVSMDKKALYAEQQSRNESRAKK